MARTLLNTGENIKRVSGGDIYLTQAQSGSDYGGYQWTGRGDWSINLKSTLAKARKLTGITCSYYITASNSTTANAYCGWYLNDDQLPISNHLNSNMPAKQSIGNSKKTVAKFTASMSFTNSTNAGYGKYTEAMGKTLLNWILAGNSIKLRYFVDNPHALSMYNRVSTSCPVIMKISYYDTDNIPKIAFVDATNSVTKVIEDNKATFSIPVKYSCNGTNISTTDAQNIYLYYTINGSTPTKSSTLGNSGNTAVTKATTSGTWLTTTLSLPDIAKEKTVKFLIVYVAGAEEAQITTLCEGDPPKIPIHLTEDGLGVGFGGYVNKKSTGEKRFNCYYPATFASLPQNFRTGWGQTIEQAGLTCAAKSTVVIPITFDPPFPDTVDPTKIHIILTYNRYGSTSLPAAYGGITLSVKNITRNGFNVTVHNATTTSPTGCRPTYFAYVDETI